MEIVKTYGPYRGKDGRARVVHYYGAGHAPRTRQESYPRYLWRQHYGEIPKGMEVDHINGDPTDDRIENYQLLTHAENARKSFQDRPEMVAKLAEQLRRVCRKGTEASVKAALRRRIEKADLERAAVRKISSETAESRAFPGF